MVLQDDTTMENKRQGLLDVLKRHVKLVMEESVTKKSIHIDSESLIALCASIDMCLSHGLKKRAGGLLPACSTYGLLIKLSQSDHSLGNIIRICTEVSKGPDKSSNGVPPTMDQHWGYLRRSGKLHLGCFWIRVVIVEKQMSDILRILLERRSSFYEPGALMLDVFASHVFVTLLEGLSSLDYSKLRAPLYGQDLTADELMLRQQMYDGSLDGYGTIPRSRQDLNASGMAPLPSLVELNKYGSSALLREHINLLHQNSQLNLLYGKNCISLRQDSLKTPVNGYLSLHRCVDDRSVILQWLPNVCLESPKGKDKMAFLKSIFVINMASVVYFHCHIIDKDTKILLVLIDEDGVQHAPFNFPSLRSLLLFLSCVDGSIRPDRQLTPPVNATRMLSDHCQDENKTNAKSQVTSSKFVFQIIASTTRNLEWTVLGRNIPWSFLPSSTNRKAFQDRQLGTPVIPIPCLYKDMGGHARNSLQAACESMNRRIITRAFHGWHSHVQYVKTIRKHLDLTFCQLQPEYMDSCAGLTTDAWESLSVDLEVNEGKVVELIFYGGMEPSLRPTVWPYLLDYFAFDSSAEERTNIDQTRRTIYTNLLMECKTLEGYLQLQERLQHLQSSAGIKAVAPPISSRSASSTSLLDTSSTAIPSWSNEKSINGQNMDSIKSLVQVAKQAGSDLLDRLLSSRKVSPSPSMQEVVQAEEAALPVVQEHDVDSLMLAEELSLQMDEIASLYSEDVLAYFSLNINGIDKDVLRCDRNYPYFTKSENLEKVRNILMAYISEHMDIGYIQGMCDLLAPLLVIFDDEPRTYGCYLKLMERMIRNFPKLNSNTMDTLLTNLQLLIQVMDAELYEHLFQSQESSHLYFAYKWLLLDFKRELDYKDVFLMWEVVWASRYFVSDQFSVFIALSLLETYRNVIIDNKMAFPDIVKFFNEMAELHDVTAILRRARSLVQRFQQLVHD